MLNQASLLPGQQTVAEPRSKSFSAELRQETSEQSNGRWSRQLYQDVDTVIQASAAEPEAELKSNVTSSSCPNIRGRKTKASDHNQLGHEIQYCPLLSECDWQLGQLLRCIHLNNNIKGCQMFSEAWKDCKRKSACHLLRHAYTNCFDTST